MQRETDPSKAWKLSVGDWKEREYWNDYMKAYEDALGKTSTKDAPWHIVPSDHKWYRNLAVTETLVETLRPFKKRWMKDLEGLGAAAKKEIAAYRRQRKRRS